MPETKGKRETIRSRTRPTEDGQAAGNGEHSQQTEAAMEEQAIQERAPERVPERTERPAQEDYGGFDAETNNRYEEIKRGGTHISELQQMTMPQLLKVAKEEGLTDYTGLKKQDLIF